MHLHNGVIRTLAGPVASELGVLGEKIVPAGLVTGDEAVDLRGRCVVPGFSDSHVHFPTWALVQDQVRLEDARSIEDVVARVGAAVDGSSSWLRGYGWREGDWPEPITVGALQALDAAAGDTPVILTSRDYHSVWVSSAGLARAGGELAVAGGVVETEDGRATGVLREAAAWAFRDRWARPTEAELLEATRAAQAIVHARGVTAVHDKDGWLGALAIWERLRTAGELRLRVWQSLPPEYLDQLEPLGVRSGFGDDWLRIGYIKMFQDGTLGSGTALLEDGSGVTITSPEEIEEHTRRAARAGFPVAVHAIGDRANRQVLDALERTRDAWQPAGLRPRIEHAQLLRDEDVERFGRLGVTASVQFSHLPMDRDLADEKWSEIAHRAYRFRGLLAAGARLCNGSDAPIDELDPLRGIRAGVQRSLDGRPAWHPDECLTVEEALWATCAEPAWLARAEDRLGRLAPGMLADLVVLDRDPVTCGADELAEVSVVATMIGGSWVHNPPPWD